MKRSSLLLAIAVFVVGAQAQASPIKVGKSADGSALLETKIKTETIGLLKVPQGSVKFSGSNVVVGAVPDWLFDKHSVLTGRVLNNKIATNAGKTTVEGTVYFLDGDWVNSFANIKKPDTLTLTDGSTLAGRLRAAGPDGLDFQVQQTGQTRRIKPSEFSSVSSPRAYGFSIPCNGVKIDSNTGELTGDAEGVIFAPTYARDGRKLIAAKKDQPQEPKSVLSGSEGGVSKKQLTGMLLLDAANTIAPAIVAPIVSPLGAKPAINRLRETSIQDQRAAADDMFVRQN